MKNLLSPRREVDEFRPRLRAMVVAVFVAFALLLGRLVQLQVLESDHWSARARGNVMRTIELRSTRGIIRDRLGNTVATNRPAFNVYITPAYVDIDRDLGRLASWLGLTDEQVTAVKQRLQDATDERAFRQYLVLEDITRDQLATLETHRRELRGVDVVSVPVRQYPYGTLAAHSVGYLNEVSAEELDRLREQGYRAGDSVGRSGIERSWEAYLRGRRGFQKVYVDSSGMSRRDRVPGMPPAERMRREPVPGRDLVLTLDMGLERIVERAFRGHPVGAAVVLEARSGRVLALFSKPAYDPNLVSTGLDREQARELLDNPFRPLIDRTVYEHYPPGSTWKVFTALAALGDSVIDPSVSYECEQRYEFGRRIFRCSHDHDEVDMSSALVQSCNIYFYQISQLVGMDRLARYAVDMGFGRRSGVGIATEASGFVPTRSWYLQRDGAFRLGATLSAAIGQGNVRATLLQLGLAYASIVNGGTLYVPQLVQRVEAPDGTVLEEFPPRVRRRIRVAPQHLDFIRRTLAGVLTDPNGTAHDALIAGAVSMGGKTGTAQVPQQRMPRDDPRRAWFYNRPHAWFAAYAPVEDPEIVVVVLVEHGGDGGRFAAPIATQIINEYLGPRRSDPTEPQEAQPSRAPRPTGAPSGAQRSH
ncbi:MAG: penicillin-binding protein 2 [Deltaproteobacteria bacterium]|nr:penicillin-binding protein 2 [Deltaproteobacteria bacterium]